MAIDDYYLKGLKTLNGPVKILDPEWNDWLKENQNKSITRQYC